MRKPIRYIRHHTRQEGTHNYLYTSARDSNTMALWSMSDITPHNRTVIDIWCLYWAEILGQSIIRSSSGPMRSFDNTIQFTLLKTSKELYRISHLLRLVDKASFTKNVKKRHVASLNIISDVRGKCISAGKLMDGFISKQFRNST